MRRPPAHFRPAPKPRHLRTRREAAHLIYSIDISLQNGDSWMEDRPQFCLTRDSLMDVLAEVDDVARVEWHTTLAEGEGFELQNQHWQPTRLGKRTRRKLADLVCHAPRVVKLFGLQPDGQDAILRISSNGPRGSDEAWDEYWLAQAVTP